MDLRSASSKNHYELLGLTQEATTQEIRASYHELARVYHPDSNYYSDILNEKVSPEQIELFKIITSAYQTLIDPKKRQEYDTLLRPLVSEKVKLWEDSDDSFWDKQVAFGANGQAAAPRKRARTATFGQTGAKPFKPAMHGPTPNRTSSTTIRKGFADRSVNDAIRSNSRQKSKKIIIVSAGIILGLACVGVIVFSSEMGATPITQSPTQNSPNHQVPILPNATSQNAESWRD